MELSKSALELIKIYETGDGKPHLKAIKSPETNKDGSIKYEIGYGHNSDKHLTVTADTVIDYATAEKLLKEDTKEACILVNDILKSLNLCRIAQHEYDALVMAVYNGVQFYNKNTNSHKILVNYFKNRCENTEKELKSAWLSWSKATINGIKKTLDGLKLRRLDEIELFFKGDYERDYNMRN